MKVLTVYPYSAYPLDHGGKIRGHQILEAIAASHSVHFVAIGSEADQLAAREWPLAKKFSGTIIVDAHRREELTPEAARLRNHQPNPLIGRPSWMRRRDLPQLWNALAGLPLQDFDFIHARNLHIAPYALAIGAAHPRKKLLLDLDDIASILALRGIRSQRLPWWSRWRAQSYLDFLRMRSYERRYLNGFDSVWVCSEQDQKIIGNWIGAQRAAVVPNVTDADSFAQAREAKRTEPIIILVGNFAMEPNAIGARFFYDKIWPHVIERVPQARLWLVGREPQPELRALDGHNGVSVFGSVPDVKPYLGQASVAVAPLLVGAGTRVKILESFAAGVPVVSTAVGAEGIAVTNGKDIFIADDPAKFADGCVRLLTDTTLHQQMRAAAFDLIQRQYNVTTLRKAVLDCYAQISPGGPSLPASGQGCTGQQTLT